MSEDMIPIEVGVIPAGPRLVMTKSENQIHGQVVAFKGEGPEQFYMSEERWGTLGGPTEIEVRLEVNATETME